jgi:diguanylate cyclase (GGDEF)-like protein/PAS domain S-box-containing protein
MHHVGTVERERRRSTMRNDPALLQAILTSATDYAIITMDNTGVINGWSAGAERILGYREDEVLGMNGRLLFTPEDRAQRAPEREMETARAMGRAADNRWHLREDGSRFWGEGIMSPIYDASETHIGYLKIMRDFTDRKRADDEVFRLAHFDNLTGLPNAAYLLARLGEMISATEHGQKTLVIQVIDLDKFRSVNDTLGHHVGDAVLQQIAQRMRGAIHESDFLGRLAGDKFAILQHVRSTREAETLASKLIDALMWPFYIEGREVSVSVSIGIVRCPQDSQLPDQLLQKADIALYRVKHERHGGGFAFFSEKIDREARERSFVLGELRRAVKRRSFRLEYQPTVACKDEHIVSVEALLRFGDASLSDYPIAELIGLCSQNDLMCDIGSWVLAEACAQFQRWRDAGLPPVRMSVNLSPRELTDSRLRAGIDAMLDRCDWGGCSLEIEITERQLHENGDAGIKALRELKARGISIALDDFGNGYSLLSGLRDLPVNKIKLDPAFSRGTPTDPKSNAMAKAVIDMAHVCGLEVIAEGVESIEQADFFRREGCDAIQGYVISPPLSADGISALLFREIQRGVMPAIG